jgi:multidrug efflux system membrane fusion protein
MSAKRRIIVTLLGSLVIAGVAAVYFMPWQPSVTQVAWPKRKGGGGPGTATDPIPVVAVDARLANVPVYLDGVGTARALNTVTVRAQVDGRLLNILFTEGQDVPKGFRLAKIDPTIYQAQFDQAVAKKTQDEATLANAKLDLERYMRLASTNAINKQQLDTQKALVNQLEAQVKADMAAIENARAYLSYTDVVAPIAGRTGIRLIDEGNLVKASDTTGIVVITQLQPISVFFSLPQQVLPELSRGLAEGVLPVAALSADGRTVLDRGKVVVVDNQVDQTTGTVKIKGEFPNANLQLWPGQFVNIQLLIDTLRQVVVVPTAAVQRGPTGPFVYVVKDDSTVGIRPVTITKQDDREAVLGSGVKAGDRVVTTGFARLTDGTRVTVSASPQAKPPEAGPTSSVTPPARTKGGDRRSGETQGSGERTSGRASGASPGTTQ